MALSPAVGSLFAVLWIRFAPRLEHWWDVFAWGRDRKDAIDQLKKCITEARALAKDTQLDTHVLNVYTAGIKKLDLRLAEVSTAHFPSRPWTQSIDIGSDPVPSERPIVKTLQSDGGPVSGVNRTQVDSLAPDEHVSSLPPASMSIPPPTSQPVLVDVPIVADDIETTKPSLKVPNSVRNQANQGNQAKLKRKKMR